MNHHSGKIEINGIGVATSLGDTIESLWKGLKAGELGYDVGESAQRGDFWAAKPEVTGSGDERLTVMAVTAVRAAWQDAVERGVSEDELKAGPVIVATSLGSIFEQGQDIVLDSFWDEGAEQLGSTGPWLTVSSACSSGTDAVGVGAELVQEGCAKTVTVVGVDNVDVYKVAGHTRLKTLSVTGCHPFDENADGTVLGEGAGALILSSAGRAARPRGQVSGYAASTDVVSLTAPDPSGEAAARMLVEVMGDSGGELRDVHHINCHGSGTPVNDALEASVLKASGSFGAYGPVLSATKGNLGHTLGATGALEIIIALLCLEHRFVPTVGGLRAAGASWTKANIAANEGTRLSGGMGVAASVTFGFGGANSAVVVTADRTHS